MNIPMDAARARHDRRFFYPPRLKRVMVMLFSLALGLACLLALLAGAAGDSQKGTFFLMGAFAFFLGSAGLILFRLIKRRPVIVMDAGGMTVRLNSRKAERLDWDRIADLHLMSGPRMQVLTITHRPVQSHWTDKAAFWRRGARQPLGFTRIAIPSVCVAAPLKKVEAEIYRRVGL
ncbi:MAG: hypothetical protein ACLFV8_08980 [Alphaproteobacteria bacterium]